ncbi:ABC transporter substrate-binding protein [Cohnella candidum]|uniref:ABC transporter substrate-binding protein n=1 Tax=Cohnella candidum TaxID=2674991 RepID=UPI001F1565D1|nr:sugar ABC transporter substrate-binding protein [Cohnella candidum]
MKLRNILASCTIILALIIAGCGSKSGSDSPSPASAASSPSASASSSAPASSEAPANVEITVQAPDKNNQADVQNFNDKIARFQKAYPNVKVNTTDWAYSPNEIGIKMAANEAPTVYSAYATDGNFLAGKGWIADLTGLLDQYAYKDQFNDILLKPYTINGKIYGIPDSGYTIGIALNKKLLADKGIPLPPMDWTWDDFLQIAQKVSDPAKGIAGIAVMGKGNEAGWGWTNFFYEAGGDVQKVENGKVTATFNSDAGVKALDFYKKLNWEAKAFPESWSLDWGGAVGAFTQGRAAMVYVGPTDAIVSALNNGQGKIEDFAAYPMPSMEKGGEHVGVLGSNSWVINANASGDQQKAAFDWVTFDFFGDAGLKSTEDSIKQLKDQGKYFVQRELGYWKADSDYGLKMKAVYDKYDNVWQYDPQFFQYAVGKPEAQYEAQSYYAAMTIAVQGALSNKNADSKKLLDQAVEKVQKENFDKVKVQ